MEIYDFDHLIGDSCGERTGIEDLRKETELNTIELMEMFLQSCAEGEPIGFDMMKDGQIGVYFSGNYCDRLNRKRTIRKLKEMADAIRRAVEGLEKFERQENAKEMLISYELYRKNGEWPELD